MSKTKSFDWSKVKRGILWACLAVIAVCSSLFAIDYGESYGPVYAVLFCTILIVLTIHLAKKLPNWCLWFIQGFAIAGCFAVAIFVCAANMLTQISLQKNAEYASLIDEIETKDDEILESRILASEYKDAGQNQNWIVENRNTSKIKNERTSLKKKKRKMMKGEGEYSVGEMAIYGAIASNFKRFDVGQVATFISLMIGFAGLCVEISLACELLGKPIMNPLYKWYKDLVPEKKDKGDKDDKGSKGGKKTQAEDSAKQYSKKLLKEQNRTETGLNGRNSTVLEENVSDIGVARKKKESKKRTDLDRSGKTSTRYLDPMLYALEHITVPKPSQSQLKKVAKGGSNSTVTKALEVGRKAKWVEKPEGGQWRFTAKHLASKSKQA